MTAGEIVRALAAENCAMCERGAKLYINLATGEYLHHDGNMLRTELDECEAGIAVWSPAAKLGVETGAEACDLDL